jgi:putative DNA primase/helicase
LGEGRNGKSTWVNLLLKMVGLENCCSVALQHLSRRFKKAEMKGKLINFYTDLPDITMAVTDDFKIVTSGDPVSIERKYYDSETVRLTAKHIYSANSLPKSMDESYGFFSRLIMIDYPNRFEGDNADPFLLQKLTTPAELSGLLNLAISGLRRLLKAGRFSYSKNVEEVAAEYKMKSSPVTTIADFMAGATLKDSKEAALKDDLYLAYKGWCLETGEEEIIHSKDELCRVIYQGYAVTETQITVRDNKQRKRALRGICLSEEGSRLANLGKSITPPTLDQSRQIKVLA